MSTNDRLPAVEHVWAELVDDADPGPNSSTTPPGTSADPGPQTGPRIRPGVLTVRVTHVIAAAVRFVASHTLPGLRHAAAVIGHWTALRHMSDDELRRRLVKRHLDAYVAQREDSRAEIERLGKKVRKISRDAADFGLTMEERRSLVDLSRSLQYRRNAGSALARIPFDAVAVQPSREQVRRARSIRALARAVGVILPASAGLVVLVVTVPLVGLLALPILAGGAWWLGHHPITLAERPIPADLMGPELAPPAAASVEELGGDVPAPYPIAQATTPEEAAEALRRALAKERAAVAEVRDPMRTSWGWQLTVILAGGRPGDIVRLVPNLTTTLRVGQSRIMAAGTDPSDAAVVTVRILTSDPFAAPPAYPVRAPFSCSILNPVSLGLSLDGEATDVILAGLHMLVVAVSGGGKSTMLRTVAEYATACKDAVVWDIDPTGRGLGPLRGTADRTAYTEEEIDDALAELVRHSERRIAALPDTEDNWQVTPDQPAIIAIVDEYAKLSKQSKQNAIELLRTGRKARITLVVCTTDATSDIMGDAVADSFGIRALMPCREADVPLVIGDRTAIAAGWLPHLLVPSPGEWDPADAGCFYLLAPRHRTPILRRTLHLDAPTALARATERIARGLPSIDRTTTGQTDPRPTPDVLRLLREAFHRHGDPEWLTVDQVHAHLRATDPERWGQWDDRVDRVRLGMVARTLQRLLDDADVELSTTRLTEPKNKPTVYLLRDVEQALATFS
jgi:hypothetical protein